MPTPYALQKRREARATFFHGKSPKDLRRAYEKRIPLSVFATFNTHTILTAPKFVGLQAHQVPHSQPALRDMIRTPYPVEMYAAPTEHYVSSSKLLRWLTREKPYGVTYHFHIKGFPVGDRFLARKGPKRGTTTFVHEEDRHIRFTVPGTLAEILEGRIRPQKPKRGG